MFKRTLLRILHQNKNDNKKYDIMYNIEVKNKVHIIYNNSVQYIIVYTIDRRKSTNSRIFNNRSYIFIKFFSSLVSQKVIIYNQEKYLTIAKNNTVIKINQKLTSARTNINNRNSSNMLL